MQSPINRIGWTAVLTTALVNSAHAITLAPTTDFQTQGNSNSPTGGQSGGTSLNFRFVNSPRVDNRFGMEFPLAGLSSSHVVAGVSWRGTPTSVTGNSLLEFHGYVGNGTFSSTDTYNPANLIGLLSGVTTGGEQTIEFDPGYVSALIGTAPYFGVYARERNDGVIGTFASRTTATPPRLDVILIDPFAPNSNRWQATGTQPWNVTANWSLGIPIASDDIFIRPTTASTVLAPSSDRVVNTLTLGGGGAQAEFVLDEGHNFTSNGITTLATGGMLRLGNNTYQTRGLNTVPGGTIDWGANGVLAIEDGYLSTPTGDFVVDGTGTPILAMLGAKMVKLKTGAPNPDRVIVGSAGGGYLLVAGQSDIRLRALSVGTQATGRGNVQVEDAGTLLQVNGLFEIGANGSGDVSIEQQARLEGGLVVVGSTLQGVYDTNTVDRFTITGAGTTAKLSSLESNGKSIVEIKDGAVVEASGIGGSGDAAQPPVMRVTGAGSRIIVTDRVQTGSTFSANDSSKLFVENGGRIDTDLLILAVGSAMTGTSRSELTITGAGSQVNTTDSVFFGALRAAEATLNVLDGGVLRAGAQTFMSARIDAVATAQVVGAGSRWEQTGELHVGGARDLNSVLVDLGPADFDIDDGGALVATGAVNIMQQGVLDLMDGELKSPLIRHDRGGQFNFTGGTLIVDEFIGDLVQQGGTLAAGASPGATSITGNYTLEAGGALEVELAGTGTPGIAYDHYDIMGLATLDGTLDVKLLDGFVPSAGDSFAFLTGEGGFDGIFSLTNLPPLPDGLTWQINPGATTMFLNVVGPGLAGDYNNDGTVDAADYVAWRRNDGTQTGYNNWRGNFGQASGSGAQSPPVPEPTTAWLVALTMLTLAHSSTAIRHSRYV